MQVLSINEAKGKVLPWRLAMIEEDDQASFRASNALIGIPVPESGTQNTIQKEFHEV